MLTEGKIKLLQKNGLTIVQGLKKMFPPLPEDKIVFGKEAVKRFTELAANQVASNRSK